MAAEKILIPESLVLSKKHSKTQFYDRNGNIASLPNKQVKVFDDEERGWEAVDAGNTTPEEAPAADDGQGDLVLDALDRGSEMQASDDAQEDADLSGDAPEIAGDESGVPEEPAATAPAQKPKTKRGSGKTGGLKMASKAKVAAAPKKAAAKKAGKVTVVAQPKKVNGQGTGLTRSVAGRVHDISGYTKSRNAAGHISYDNGDTVAEQLRGKTLDEVYTKVAKALKEDEKVLRAKYKALNTGMQRMALGNRLRKVLKDKAAAAA